MTNGNDLFSSNSKHKNCAPNEGGRQSCALSAKG